MKVILSVMGSGGDVDPALGLGKELQKRGHEATVITHFPFKEKVERAGLKFVAVDSQEQYDATLHDPGMMTKERLLKHLSSYVHTYLEPFYEKIAEQYVPGETFLVNGLPLGGKLAFDKFQMPMATLHLSPFAFLDLDQELVDKLDEYFGPFINEYRSELGLGPIKGIFDGWCVSPQLVLGLFPEWFAGDIKRPPHTILTGFPLYNVKEAVTIPPELETFLQAGDPPILFTFGTAMHHIEDLLQECVKTCQQLGRRGMLLTQFEEQVPSDLPETVRHFKFIPFSAVFPKTAAVVHHGGIGTLSQALVAEVPQMVVPFAFDQPSNGAILKDLGIADVLLPQEFKGETAAAKLKPLLEDPAVIEKCRALGKRMEGMDGLGGAADAVVELAQRELARL